MKNLGSIVLLLAAGAGYVASLPAGEAPANQVRSYEGEALHEMLAREPKKNKGAAGKSPLSKNPTKTPMSDQNELCN